MPYTTTMEAPGSPGTVVRLRGLGEPDAGYTTRAEAEARQTEIRKAKGVVGGAYTILVEDMTDLDLDEDV